MANDMSNIAKETLRKLPGVAAAYLFGSKATGEAVANDVDILVLPYPSRDKNSLYFDLLYRLSQDLDLPEDQIDLLLFDLQEADLRTLYNAVTTGIIIKNESPEFLSENIEQLSNYLVSNEFILKETDRLIREQLEAF